MVRVVPGSDPVAPAADALPNVPTPRDAPNPPPTPALNIDPSTLRRPAPTVDSRHVAPPKDAPARTDRDRADDAEFRRWRADPNNLSEEIPAPGSAGKPSPLVGYRLGWSGVEVSGGRSRGADFAVTQEVGPREGYPTRLQALAAAAEAGPQAAIMSEHGRYHVVLSNLQSVVPNIDVDDIRGSVIHLADGPYEIELPSRASRDDLAAAARSLDAKTASKDPAVRMQAYVHATALALGVPETDIHVSQTPADNVPGKINICLAIDARGQTFLPDGANPWRLPSEAGHTPATPTIAIGAQAFANYPTMLRMAVLHEGTHLAHAERAIALYNQWQREGQNRSFGGWLDHEQHAGRITEADANVTIELTTGDKTTTEMLASIEEFAATYPNVDPNGYLSFSGLFDYAINQHFDVAAGVRAVLYDRLRTVYAGLDSPHQAAFRDLLTSAAVKEAPFFRDFSLP